MAEQSDNLATQFLNSHIAHQGAKADLKLAEASHDTVKQACHEAAIAHARILVKQSLKIEIELDALVTILNKDLSLVGDGTPTNPIASVIFDPGINLRSKLEQLPEFDGAKDEGMLLSETDTVTGVQIECYTTTGLDVRSGKKPIAIRVRIPLTSILEQGKAGTED